MAQFTKRYGESTAGWREIGDNKCYFRSKWEANFCRYLEFQKKHRLIVDWHHEPETFWFTKIMRGVRSYKPDFKVMKLDGTHVWYEVKGYADPKSLTKLKRFSKYYPDEEIFLIDKSWFTKNQPTLSRLIGGWER